MLLAYLFSRESLSALLYYFFFGQVVFLVYFLVPFSVYLAWSLSLLGIEGYVFHNHSAREGYRSFFRSLILLAAVFVFLFGAIALIMSLWVTYYPQKRVDIAAIDNFMLSIDHYLSGTYIPFWFHLTDNPLKGYFDTAAPLLIRVYVSLAFGLSGALLFLVLFNKRAFIHLFTAFVVTLIISMPLWYMLPALSPLDAYLYPLIAPTIPADVQRALDRVELNQSIREYTGDLAKLNSGRANWFLPITCMPSMHIAWVTLIVFFLAVAWRPTLLVTIPYFLLNFMATIYTLQHYTVDVVAGIPLAAVAIMAAYAIRPHEVKAVAVLLKQMKYDQQRLRAMAPKSLMVWVTKKRISTIFKSGRNFRNG